MCAPVVTPLSAVAAHADPLSLACTEGCPMVLGYRGQKGGEGGAQRGCAPKWYDLQGCWDGTMDFDVFVHQYQLGQHVHSSKTTCGRGVEY